MNKLIRLFKEDWLRLPLVLLGLLLGAGFIYNTIAPHGISVYTRVWVYDKQTHTTIADITGNCTTIVYTDSIQTDCVTRDGLLNYRFDRTPDTSYILESVSVDKLINSGDIGTVYDQYYLNVKLLTPKE